MFNLGVHPINTSLRKFCQFSAFTLRLIEGWLIVFNASSITISISYKLTLLTVVPHAREKCPAF